MSYILLLFFLFLLTSPDTGADLGTSRTTVLVKPRYETEPVPSAGDAADDVALWLHPSRPAESLVFGTDKKAGIGLYQLNGRRVAFHQVGAINNIDIRYAMRRNTGAIDILAGSNRDTNSIDFFSISGEGPSLIPLLSVPTGFRIYGLCLYKNLSTGQISAIALSKDGGVQQWQLEQAPYGKLVANKVREFNIGSQSEGCVADDENGALYVAEEGVGIWRYGAEPTTGELRKNVDLVSQGHLSPDVEGLALYRAKAGQGYLVASSQGSDSFAVYSREAGNQHLFNFSIVEGATVDGVTKSDGLDILSFGLGELFPFGAFVVQDDDNMGAVGAENQNFKLVGWEDIARVSPLKLIVDSSVNPRVP